MTALIHATNALYGVDTESYRQVMATLSDQVMLDLQADSEYYQAHKVLLESSPPRSTMCT